MANEFLKDLIEELNEKATPEERAWSEALREEFALEVQKMKFIGAVKRARKEAGLSQRALAKLVGMQQHDLCRLEKGKTNPTFETQQKLFTQLGIEVSYRLTRSPAGEASDSVKTKRELQKTA